MPTCLLRPESWPVAALLLALVGCGGEADDDGDRQPTAGAATQAEAGATTPPPEAEPEPVEGPPPPQPVVAEPTPAHDPEPALDLDRLLADIARLTASGDFSAAYALALPAQPQAIGLPRQAELDAAITRLRSWKRAVFPVRSAIDGLASGTSIARTEARMTILEHREPAAILLRNAIAAGTITGTALAEVLPLWAQIDDQGAALAAYRLWRDGSDEQVRAAAGRVVASRAAHLPALLASAAADALTSEPLDQDLAALLLGTDRDLVESAAGEGFAQIETRLQALVEAGLDGDDPEARAWAVAHAGWAQVYLPIDPTQGLLAKRPDQALSASSEYSPEQFHGAQLARFKSKRAWSARTNNVEQWLQVDLGEVGPLIGVGTKGRHDQDQWVKAYRVSVSVDGSNWQPAVSRDGADTFAGNSDRETPVVHHLGGRPRCRYVRFHPTAWHGHVSMRVECYR